MCSQESVNQAYQLSTDTKGTASSFRDPWQNVDGTKTELQLKFYFLDKIWLV